MYEYVHTRLESPIWDIAEYAYLTRMLLHSNLPLLTILQCLVIPTRSIIELVSNITEPLHLPGWTTTLVILLLVIGFPITAILSWIFDVTPEGIIKTELIEGVSEFESNQTPVRRRPKLSDVIIAVLFVAVCVLLYPKIFKSDQFSALRDENGMISVAVLPFDNLTGDSSLYFWENGISEYLINGLGSSDELAVSSSQVITDVLEGTKQINTASLSPNIARKTASKINASTYITGNYIGIGNDFTIMLNLLNTENGELIWTTKVNGNLETNYRATLDWLTDTVRNYMEIKALEEKVETDLSNAYPNSAEAYRHYIDGLNAIVAGTYESAIESLLAAYNIDTTFTFAAFYLAFAHCFSGQSDLFDGQYRWIRRAHELKNNLPPAYHPWIELWYVCSITEDIGDIRRYCDLLSKAALHSRFLLLDLGVTYSDFLGDYNKSIQAYEKLEALNRQWEDDWRYTRFYLEYCWTLLMADRPEEAYRIAEKGLQIDPESGWMILHQCSSSAMLGDSLVVKERLSDLKAVLDKYNASESDRERYTGLMYLFAKDTLMAEKHYRKAYKLDPENLTKIIILARVLIESEINMKEGLALSETGLNMFPDDWQLLMCKGLALHKLGKHEEALTILNKADEMAIGYYRLLAGYIQEVEHALASKNN